MNKMNKAYFDRAAEIVGDRSSGEIAHDDAVVEALIQGRTIKEALAIASKKYPDEELKWDDGNIGDIAAHYEYLNEHSRIMGKLRMRPDK